jgi:hypothetical protein
MKYVSLRGHAYVNGVLRSPDEGPVKLNDEDAKRLIDAELAVDVTEDFPDDDDAAPAKVTVKPSDPKAA